MEQFLISLLVYNPSQVYYSICQLASFRIFVSRLKFDKQENQFNCLPNLTILEKLEKSESVYFTLLLNTPTDPMENHIQIHIFLP